MHFSNLTSLTKYRSTPVTITQCTSFNGLKGNCTNSPFQIHDIGFSSMKGPTLSTRVATFSCSAVAPCYNIEFEDIEMTYNGAVAASYGCTNVATPIGWNCTTTA
jgi:galacturan 1,4-alpha-galacturonidase